MKHFVNNRELFEQYPEGMSEIILGAGCFWGVERVFWKLEGVWVTYASYSGGRRVNPNYEQICTGVTGHAETVNVIFDKNIISLNAWAPNCRPILSCVTSVLPIRFPFSKT